MKTIDQITEWLKENLDEERFLHSLGVADCARDLAKRYGLDEKKAYLAGLVHDCAKCYSKEVLEDIIKNKMHCDSEDFVSPKTFHSPAGAYVAEKEFGITDEEILSAIFVHTVGKLNMSEFEKIIFLADKIEPNTREKSWTEHIMKVLDLENGLNKALLECYAYTIKSLVDRRLQICLTTIKIFNELLNNTNT